MSQTRVLVVGGTGMLGHKLACLLARCGDMDTHVSTRGLPSNRFRAMGATYHTGIELSPDRPELAPLIRNLRPDVILNAAGAIKHRDLTSNPASTLFLNGTLPHALAALNTNPQGRVIHFSTDCVFTGAEGGYRESSQPNASDLYGVSKASGELRYSPHLTIRTSIIGFEIANHLGLLEWFFRQPAGAHVNGYRKAIFSGLPTVTLGNTVLHIIRNELFLTGLYHVASEPISKFDLLTRIASAFALDRTIVASDDTMIDRSLNDEPFRQRTHTTTPSWDALIQELMEDGRSLPYESMEAVR